jgi:hypothetical protein
MSTPAGVLSAVRQPAAALTQPLQAGLVGLLWVLFNILLVWLGARTQHPGSCSIAAGGVDGAILSVIAVTKVSARFRSGATGLLGGISMTSLKSDASLLTSCAQTIHSFVDRTLTALNLAVDEGWHDQIEHAVIWTLWVAILVVLASLIAEWASTSWRKD